METVGFKHDIFMHGIYPLLDIPTLLAWRQVCRASLAVLNQGFWYRRLCFPIMGNSTGERELLEHYDFPNYTGPRRMRNKKNPGPLCRLLNILKKRPAPQWYKEKKRIMVLHSARDRARIHKVAAILGLYTRTVYTQDIHLWSNESNEDGYNSGGEPIILDIRAVPEMGVVVYWNPDEIPPYEAAAPKAERPVLAEVEGVTKQSRDIWEHGSRGYFYGMRSKYLGRRANHTDAIYEEAQQRWCEIQGHQEQQWLSSFAEAHAYDPEKIRPKNLCNGSFYPFGK